MAFIQLATQQTPWTGRHLLASAPKLTLNQDSTTEFSTRIHPTAGNARHPVATSDIHRHVRVPQHAFVDTDTAFADDMHVAIQDAYCDSGGDGVDVEDNDGEDNVSTSEWHAGRVVSTNGQ